MTSAKNSIILAVCIVVFPSVTLAGAAAAKLTCKSIDTKKPSASIEGHIPDMYPELDLEYKWGKSKTIFSYPDSKAFITEAFKDGVFTMNVFSKTDTFEMYALPRTIKIKTGMASKYVQFNAMVKRATKPEYSGPPGVRAQIFDYKMTCVYDWHL